MHENKMESDGYNVIMSLVREFDDSGDPWGSNIGWLFALCDYAYLIDGEIMPNYRPSPLLNLRSDLSWELELLFESNVDFQDEDVRRAYIILDRRDSLLRLAGKDY